MVDFDNVSRTFETLKHSFFPRQDFNCFELIKNSTFEIKRVANFSFNDIFTIPDSTYAKLASNCTKFVQNRGYITAPISAAEENFPLAFSILMYKDVEQFERLLRAIYRPQNFYCVHVDKKSKKDVQNGARAVASCFPNVFVPPDTVEVKWGKFSVLEAELICMRHLLNGKNWR